MNNDIYARVEENAERVIALEWHFDQAPSR